LTGPVSIGSGRKSILTQTGSMSSSGVKPASILFVIRYFYPYIGGLEKQTLNFASVLRQRGIRVAIVTSRFYWKWPREDVINDVPVYRLPSPRIKIVGAIIFLACLGRYLFKNRNHFAMVHAFQVGYSSALAIFLCSVFNKPAILSLAGSGTGGDVCRHRRTPWGRLFLFLCRYASRIVVKNREMITELQSINYHSRNAIYIPNGVDLTVYRETDEKDVVRKKLRTGEDKVILYTGRLSSEKGVDFLIHAYSGLSLDMPTKLFIIGTGRELYRLQKLVSYYNEEDNIIILPAADDIVSYLQIADIFVMPSRHEGLSNSILEAMACAVPVVATRVSGNMEVIEDGVTGMLVSRDHYQNLTDALAFLLMHPDKARELGLKAKQAVQEKYDLQVIADQYLALYTTVAEKSTL
jgi:glycosyltransferase involved in cell wall biosynthesis